MHGIKQQHRHDAALETEGRTIRGWAKYYDLMARVLTLGREGSLRREIIQRAAIPTGGAVLDVGCGTGTLALLAKAEAGDKGRVCGIDPAPEMIDVARHKAVHKKRDLEFQIAAIESLPYPDGTFDVVLSSLMFHHLPPELKRRGLAEVYRVLKPGGRLLIVDMATPKTHLQRLTLMALVHHGQTNDVHDLAPLLRESGYAEIQTGSMRWSALGFIQGQRGE